MITEFLITIIFNAVALIVNIFEILPDVSISSAITNSLTAIGPYYSSLNAIFPMPTLLAILAIELTFIGANFTYKIIRWGYTKIPGLS